MHNRERIRIPLALALLAISSMLAAPPAAAQDARKPHIVIIWGDDIGQSNLTLHQRPDAEAIEYKYRFYSYGDAMLIGVMRLPS